MESLLDGIPCRIQGYRLFIPASGIEDQSLPWGICFYRIPRNGSHTHMVIELVRSEAYPIVKTKKSDN